MKNFIKGFITIIIIFILLTYSTISLAVNLEDINGLKNQQSDTKSEIKATQNKINEISNEREQTLSQVEKLISQISDYQIEIDSLNTKINDIKKRIDTVEKQIKEDEAEYEKQQKALDDRLVAMYEAGETSYLDFLLSSASLVDFISSYYLVSEVAEYDNKMLEQLEEHKTKIEKEKNDLENDKKELDNSKVTLVSKKQGLEIAKKSKEQYVADLSEDEKKLEAELSELASHEQSINKRIATLQAQYDKERAEAAKKAAASSNKKNGSSSSSGISTSTDKSTSKYGFIYPVTNHHIGTGYGVSGSYWSSGHHTGVDFPVSTGTAVYSIGDGQVVDTGYNRAYGNFVEVYHGNNIYSFYAHASSVIVSVGQYVSKGQQIMRSGATGNVTGPHLHFEIRTPGPRYANCVNPMNYIS